MRLFISFIIASLLLVEISSIKGSNCLDLFTEQEEQAEIELNAEIMKDVKAHFDR